MEKETKLLVCDKMCDQCLFSKNRIVSTARAEEIIEKTKELNTHFQCHKASVVGMNVCCRGFYENVDTLEIRLAKELKIVEFVKVDDLLKERINQLRNRKKLRNASENV